jgi:hypothetical protein
MEKKAAGGCEMEVREMLIRRRREHWEMDGGRKEMSGVTKDQARQGRRSEERNCRKEELKNHGD